MENQKHKYLLLDRRIVETKCGVKLELGNVQKDEANPLFGEDKPWEVRFDNLYPNVIYDRDEKLYKCWYSPFIVSSPEENTPVEKRKTIKFTEAGLYPREMAVCYAISENGIEWIKPDIGIYEFKGSTENNIVYRLRTGANEDGVHGAGVFKDERDPDASRRYKMFFVNAQQIMSVSFSADGIHWSDPILCENIQAIGDTHNNALWDSECEKYIGITRLWNTENHDKHIRLVGHTESRDFINWTKAKIVFDGDNPDKQIYSMPVFRYAGLYLGLISILDDKKDLVYCELAYSKDTITWNRICPGQELIPLGKRTSYDCGCIYAASNPICVDDEIRIYYAGSNGRHTDWRNGSFCLARLRKDGFAGYKADSNGTITTKPVKCSSEHLAISADVSEGGSIAILISDEKENVIQTSETIISDASDKTVMRIGKFNGQMIRLRFELNRAKLYSFSFIG